MAELLKADVHGSEFILFRGLRLPALVLCCHMVEIAWLVASGYMLLETYKLCASDIVDHSTDLVIYQSVNLYLFSAWLDLGSPYFYLEFQNDVDVFTVKKTGARGESLEPEPEPEIFDNDPKQAARKKRKAEYRRQQEKASREREAQAAVTNGNHPLDGGDDDNLSIQSVKSTPVVGTDGKVHVKRKNLRKKGAPSRAAVSPEELLEVVVEEGKEADPPWYMMGGGTAPPRKRKQLADDDMSIRTAPW